MSFVPPSLPRDLAFEPVSAGIHLPPTSHPYERNVVLNHIGDEHPDEDHTSSVGSRTNVSVDLEGAGKVTLVEWEKNDPENPRNLPRLRKWIITLLSSALCLSVALGSSIVTGDIPGPAEEFHVSEEVVNLTVTLFVVGFGIGPLVFAPLSEILGRYPVYCISMGLYFIFTLPSALAPNIGCLIASRALAGIASSAPMTNVGGTLADISYLTSESVVLLATEPLLICMSGYLTLIYSLLYLFFFAYPIVFLPKGLNAGEIGLTFIGVMVGIFIAMLLLPMQEKAYRKVCGQRGVVPEARLPFMMFGSILLPFSLFIFAWTSLPHVHWIGATMAGVPFGAAMVTVYISANSYIIDTYQRYTASAVAAKTFLRSIIGATVPLWVNQMYAGMTPQWASTLLAFLAILAMPIPFVFFRYGDRIRARSTKAN
ncbi:hypothetical protein FRC06_004127 [Ceratobasidium sp. 370]|nr:hypothetical protein FRC06_004127 [Ceratobasidium sp. 370]